MDRNAIKKIVADRIRTSSGTEFQKVCWDILKEHYADLATPEMQHDLGNDGYSRDDKIFFACYAPEGEKYDNRTTVNKIEGDYQKFVENWRDECLFEKWVFITRDNLMGRPHQKILQLNKIHDGVSKEQWGLEQLLKKAMQIDEEHLRQIFNLPDPQIRIEQITVYMVPRAYGQSKDEVRSFGHKGLIHVGEKISTSEFGFENLLQQSKERIFVSGQNLYFLTRKENEKKYKGLIFKALGENKRVQIMVCNPGNRYAVKTWGQVVGAESKYKEHLDHSIETFRKWISEANGSKLNGLEVKMVTLVPLSITFVDPDQDSGKLVFTTVVYEPKAEWCPVYLISKAHQKGIFNYYWVAYKEVFEDKDKAIGIV